MPENILKREDLYRTDQLKKLEGDLLNDMAKFESLKPDIAAHAWLYNVPEVYRVTQTLIYSTDPALKDDIDAQDDQINI